MNRETYDFGLEFIKKAGVDHKINFIQSDASSALDDLIKVLMFSLPNHIPFPFIYLF